jgi:hypothetical protein
MIGQTDTCIPRSGVLGARLRSSVGSISKLIAKAGLASIVLGISVSLSSAFADINEATSKDDVTAPNYIREVLPRELVVHFLSVNYDDLTEENLTWYYRFLNNDFYDPQSGPKYSKAATSHGDKVGQRKDIDGFDDVFAPEAVWSLDVSTGAHLEHNSGEVGSELDIALSGYRMATRLRAREIFDPWTNDNPDGDSDIPLVSPSQLQVASCNGFAERPTLDRCRPSDNSEDQYVGSQQNPGVSKDRIDAASSTLSANGTPTTNQESQSDTVQNLSQLIPASVNDSGLQDVSNRANLCEDVSSCVAIGAWYLDYWLNFAGKINSPTPPIDSSIPPIEPPIPPIDSPTPPDLPPPVISVGDPWPGSGPGPISTPPTVPETSTWIMTIIGFSIMIAIGKRRGINSIKQAALGTVLKFAKQSIRRDTA